MQLQQGGCLINSIQKVVCVIASLMIVVPYFGFAFYPAIWCYWVAGFVIGLGLVCVEFTHDRRYFKSLVPYELRHSYWDCVCYDRRWWCYLESYRSVRSGPDLQGWRDLYLFFGTCIAVGTIPLILVFVKRTPQQCGTLPYGMPLELAAAQAEEAKIAGAAAQEPGYKAKKFFACLSSGHCFWVRVY